MKQDIKYTLKQFQKEIDEECCFDKWKFSIASIINRKYLENWFVKYVKKKFISAILFRKCFGVIYLL